MSSAISTLFVGQNSSPIRYAEIGDFF